MNAYGTIMTMTFNDIIKIKTPTEDAVKPVRDEGANKSMGFYKNPDRCHKKTKGKEATFTGN